MKQAAVADGVALRVERGRHLLEGDAEVGRAGGGHLLDFVELHRNGKILRRDAANPGSDHNDIVQLDCDATFGVELLSILLFRHRLCGLRLCYDAGS